MRNEQIHIHKPAEITIHAPSDQELFPLERLPELDHWFFDVEETVIGHELEDLKRNFAYFLLCMLDTSLPPKGYIQQSKEQVPVDQLIAEISARSGHSRTDIEDMIRDFAEITHVDDIRLRKTSPFLNLSNDAIWTAYTAYWNAISDNSPERAADIAPAEVIPGAVDLLNTLSQQGKHIHFITNADSARVGRLLSKLPDFGFTGTVQTFQSARETGWKKPDPYTLHSVYTQYGIHRTETARGLMYPTVMLGNSLSDVQAGLNAGCTATILVNPTQINGPVPACYQVPDLTHIAEIMKKR